MNLTPIFPGETGEAYLKDRKGKQGGAVEGGREEEGGGRGGEERFYH